MVILLLKLLLVFDVMGFFLVFFKFFLPFVPFSSIVTVRASLFLCVGWSDFFLFSFLGWVCWEGRCVCGGGGEGVCGDFLA